MDSPFKLKTFWAYHAFHRLYLVISPLGSVCPYPILPTPGQVCNLPGGLNCRYDYGHAHDCCGRCAQNFSCVERNTTSDTGLWQQMPSFCPEDCCGEKGEWSILYLFDCVLLTTGEVISQNYYCQYLVILLICSNVRSRGRKSTYNNNGMCNLVSKLSIYFMRIFTAC